MSVGPAARRTARHGAAAALALALTLTAVSCTSSSARRRPAAPSATASTVTASITHLDAHDGGIVQFGSTYYLYGTAYGCGFAWLVPGTRFCGFRMYTSTDLTTWHDRGLAFDPGAWQAHCAPAGCFRPHVVRDPGTRRYVLWFNEASDQRYVVFTAPAPLGPWTFANRVAVAPSGDESVFVDDDGVGYLVRTDLAGHRVSNRGHELEVDRLDATFTRIAAVVSRPRVGFVEAPALWRDTHGYYLAYSDPACPYCAGTGTSVIQAGSLAGPWSTPYSISATSCNGQPTMVSPLVVRGNRTLLYQSDRWVRLHKNRITPDQAAATQAWSPLRFAQPGRLAPVRCPG